MNGWVVCCIFDIRGKFISDVILLRVWYGKKFVKEY